MSVCSGGAGLDGASLHAQWVVQLVKETDGYQSGVRQLDTRPGSMTDERDALRCGKGMIELQYIPEHRWTAVSALQLQYRPRRYQSLPSNKMGGCKGRDRQSQGPFRNPVLDVVLGREGLDGGRWMAEGAGVTGAPASQIAVPAQHSDLPLWCGAPKRAGLRLFSKLETAKSLCVLCV